ncbi:MAG: hypothetical protein HY329_13045 [Chloroflexi bacterium]|nr:hypothetical protein [Chloroflexota bacterium]
MLEVEESRLIDCYIEPDRLRASPVHARIKGAGVPVRALVGLLLQTEGDVDRVVAEYRVPAEAVHAAAAFYRRHQAAIDDWLAASLTDAS